ncbi:hypothetical protein LCGC14_2291570 [marine sediment metagenome]|uniref:Uncharacterized protein n=1 Tax=marine sediment metagenome TaxID=412755 RepID=A0A0F9F3M9_9ZZZZ
MPKKPTTSRKTSEVEVASSTGLIPEAFNNLSCQVADLENEVSLLDEDLSTVINKERSDLAKMTPRENLCDLASDTMVLADRIHDVRGRLGDIRDNLEL